MDYLERRDPIAKGDVLESQKKSKNILLRNDRARIWKINQRAALLKIQNYRMIKSFWKICAKVWNWNKKNLIK